MNAQEWLNRGKELDLMVHPIAAKVCFDQAMKQDPTLPGLLSLWAWGKLLICDWSGLDDVFQQLKRSLEEGGQIDPHLLFSFPFSPEQQLQGTKAYVKDNFPVGERPNPTPGDRIRVGYFGCDFFEHATSYLMAGLFEHHDRSRFETSIFAFNPNVDDTTRRITESVDHFVDLSTASDDEVVAAARSKSLDIAVDLRGFTTQGGRLRPFGLGLAPVQTSYLAYPGTTGLPFIDYLIADPILIPPHQRDHYSEKIVYLPNSYQVNDRLRPAEAYAIPRDHFGLPPKEKGFVFGCFNRNWKIVPKVFDIWMRLLKAVPGSVLWLFNDNNQATILLKKEAEARGVSGDRLVFMEFALQNLHIARQRLADLFLDTTCCGGHTTVSDALWVGLPVVTLQGETFANRVASSLLTAAGVPELITTSEEAYEAKALELATNQELLHSLQKRLVTNRMTCPLFDTARTTKNIEAAFTAMHQRRLDGLAPEDIKVEEPSI